jgi:hypothetical protein
MALCNACESVAGKPATDEPHDRQALVARRTIEGALRLDYLCRGCSAQMFCLRGVDLMDEVWTVTVRPVAR